MRKLLCLCFTFLTLTLAQSFEESLQTLVTDPAEITTLLGSAQATIFLATPVSSKALEAELIQAVARGVNVYYITLEDNDNAQALVAGGVIVKTLTGFAEGVLLVDTTLVAGGLLSGGEGQTLRLDTTLFGSSVLDQLRAVWQVAKPLGG